MIKDEIKLALKRILKDFGIEEAESVVEHPADSSHGDYASNIAMAVFGDKELGIRNKGFKSPMEFAEKIKNAIIHDSKVMIHFDRVEAVSPGFINFWLSKDYLLKNLQEISGEKEKFGQGDAPSGLSLRVEDLRDKRVMVEFAHPNTHKEFHIGHLRNITIGESISRILEASGAEVIRTNYQGDVGLHVAKALYGVQKELQRTGQDIPYLEMKPLKARAFFLGLAYSTGAKAYEEDEEAKQEINEINKKIYSHNPEIMPLWEKTRTWSLDYFESIYERLGIKFDRLYFESEVFEPGKQVVLAHIEDGIFTKDNNTVIFDGEKYGLHKRVFITKEGNVTYEGKEMGLGPLQYNKHKFDLALHVVGPEQSSYFEVVFKALELIDPIFKGKEKHLSYGLVQLMEGKMSSRLGEIVTAETVLNETRLKLKSAFKNLEEEVLEKVAVGAVKYAMLRYSLNQNIKFSYEETISLEGNSGPYLQYTYARTQSVLAKVKSQPFDEAQGKKSKVKISFTRGRLAKLEMEELAVLRFLHRFPEVVGEAAGSFAPNNLCNYLFDLAQKFNLFYQKHKIIGSESEDFRIPLTTSVGQVLKNGLYLLGIQALERM